MLRISSIGTFSSQEEKKAVQDALEELKVQLVLYESLGKGPKHSEEERRQASKVVDAMRKVSHIHADPKIRAEYQRKLQAAQFSRENRKERRDRVNSLLKEFALVTQSREETSTGGQELALVAQSREETSLRGQEFTLFTQSHEETSTRGQELALVTQSCEETSPWGQELALVAQSHEETSTREQELALVAQSREETSTQGKELSIQSKHKVTTLEEEEWKRALDELNKQLVRYDRLGPGPEHASEEKEQAAKVVAAMHKVSDAHTDPKVKKEYKKKAEKFEKATPKQRKKQMNALLKGLLALLAAPFLLAGAAIFVAGSILYGVGSIVKGLGDLATGGLWRSSFDDASQEQSNASEPDQEEQRQ
ncbi:hypothetical protein C0995_014357 [Termitomyces sp. Mi166|nr:hypothetical protein C0995_014357 [Termitomyces sp. Mi166\